VRTRTALGSIFGTVAVLVIGWQAGAAAAHNTASPPTTTSGSSTGASTTTSPSTGTSTTKTPATTTPAATTPSGSAKKVSAAKTYAGTTVQTQFGPMQVQITVKSGKITDVTALQLTNQGGRSVQISNYAAPILRKEVLAAQSAKVSMVGGATYTSQGYLTSVQSALDKAGL
jgi:uncharacterized protein with FMN-binding domain